MDFRRLRHRTKDLVEKRGGTEALKRDAEELKKIAQGPGTASEKAKAAASALKDPGAAGPEADRAAETATPAEQAPAAERSRSREPAEQGDAGPGREDRAEGRGSGPERR